MNTIYPYAGFWKRTAAYFIDSIVVQVALQVLFRVVGLFGSESIVKLQQLSEAKAPLQMADLSSFLGLMSIILVIGICAPILYFSIMESSKLQATLGKMVLGIKVVDRNGNRLTFWRAFGRKMAKILSTLTLNIGYFMAGATRKKQALHDKLAGTYVVDKKYNPGDELPEVAPHFGLLTAAIVGELAVILLFGATVVGLVVVTAKAIQQDMNRSARPSVQQTVPSARPYTR